MTHLQGCQALKGTQACLDVDIMVCAFTIVSMCMYEYITCLKSLFPDICP